MNGVTYVSDSGNSKIMGSRKVDGTYASIKASCPNTCSLKEAGCYAQSSFVGIQVRKLDSQAEKISPLKIARFEAKAIDASYKGGKVPVNRDLRLHISGDSRTVKGTRLLNSAVARWKKRGGEDCWSYTHAWDKVHRREWNNVSILASVDSIKKVAAARKNGYAPAIVVPEHLSDKAYKLKGSNVKWIPCPAQTKPNGKQIGCTDCRLCFNADRLYENNMGIAFAAHGIKKNQIKRRLTVIQ